MRSEAVIESGVNLNRFATTRWSVVLSCAKDGTGEEHCRNALAQLCRTYWRPIFAFICRSGYTATDAQDLTQDFFLTLLEGNLLHRADPRRGRFRTLLLSALRNFLNDKRDGRRAKKRGGNLSFVSWEDWIAESPSYLSIHWQKMESLSPERLFDVRWAATVAEQALRRLAVECESRGRRRTFEMLSYYLTADRTEVCYAKLSAALNLPELSVKRLLHALRARYRALLREEVSETVMSPADLDDEIRHLCAALAQESRA